MFAKLKDKFYRRLERLILLGEIDILEIPLFIRTKRPRLYTMTFRKYWNYDDMESRMGYLKTLGLLHTDIEHLKNGYGRKRLEQLYQSNRRTYHGHVRRAFLTEKEKNPIPRGSCRPRPRYDCPAGGSKFPIGI